MERDDYNTRDDDEKKAIYSTVNSYCELFSNIKRADIKYDDWLECSFGEEIKKYIEQCDTSIIDIGCGIGNNTLYLLEKGKKVIPCDYSLVAIQSINRNFPELNNNAQHFDMTNGFPFENSFTDIIICDLSIHYFTEKTTFKVIEEIKRVLKPNGILLARVNSMEDDKFGAGQGQEIEHHLYKGKNGRYKRFFDKNDIRHFFGDWKEMVAVEDIMGRYRRGKKVWRLAMQVQKQS